MARRKPPHQPRQMNLGPGPVRCWHKATSGTGKLKHNQLIRGWTPESAMDRSKLWAMFGNVQEAQTSLDTSLQISAKMTPKAKGIYSPFHPSLSAFSFLHKNVTGTSIPRWFSETRPRNTPRTNHEPSIVFQTDTQCSCQITTTFVNPASCPDTPSAPTPEPFFTGASDGRSIKKAVQTPYSAWMGGLR